MPVELDVSATPVFSNLSASSTIGTGTPSVVFAGTISAGISIPPSTETVAITVNGVTYDAPINSQGNFSTLVDTSQLPASATPYSVTYVYAGDATFSSVSDSTTTMLTVQSVSAPLSPIKDFTWQYVKSLPVAEEAPLAAVSNGKIDVVVGNALYSYDPSTNNWASLASLPGGGVGWGGAAVVNSKLYAIGFGSTPSTEIYDPSLNSWTAGAPMPTPRYYGTVAAVGGKVYAIGGSNGGTNAFGTVEAYDPTTNTWASCAPMPTPRASAAAVTVNGLIYVFGGAGNDNQLSWEAVEVYNPASNTWTSKSYMPTMRAGGAAVAVGGEIYLLAGYDGQAGSGFLASVDEYDPTTDSWQTLTSSLLTARGNSPAAAVLNGNVYVIGGDSNTGVTATVEEGIPRDHFSVMVRDQYHGWPAGNIHGNGVDIRQCHGYQL